MVTLVNGEVPAGVHQSVWDAKGFASGVYLARPHAGSFVDTKNTILAR